MSCFKRFRRNLGTDEEKNYKVRHCLESMHSMRTQFNKRKNCALYWDLLYLNLTESRVCCNNSTAGLSSVRLDIGVFCKLMW